LHCVQVLHKLTGESEKVSELTYELTAFAFEVSAIVRHWKARVMVEFVCECLCVCVCVYACMHACMYPVDEHQHNISF
jgi:hypothetical protein